MTLEEALRFIDPETDTDALAEAEYYGGFNGKEQDAQKLKEASRMVVDFIRRVSWHDAKTHRLSTIKAGRTRERSAAAS